MKVIKCLVALVVLVSAQLPPLQSQQPPAPNYHQVLHYIKVPQAGRVEFEQLMKDTSLKAAETRVKAGEIVSWTLLRSVMPSGTEARGDYLVSILYDGVPTEPLDRAGNEALMKKAGVAMTGAAFYEKRDRLSALVCSELWRPLSRVGAPEKGHYLFINQMKVSDADAYVAFERDVWRPMAEQRAKDGEMSGWIFATKLLPSGDATPYRFYTADMFPTWAAAFKNWSAEDLFKKVHPGKNIDEAFANLEKLRSLAMRELWVVTERVAK